MSRINGDKARFHKNRKEKIERRKRNQEMFSKLTGKSTAAKPSAAKAK
jgi:hypothetical protein